MDIKKNEKIAFVSTAHIKFLTAEQQEQNSVKIMINEREMRRQENKNRNIENVLTSEMTYKIYNVHVNILQNTRSNGENEDENEEDDDK